MNTLPSGYVRRTDGLFEKRVEFLCGIKISSDLLRPTRFETLVRSRTGRLLRVERSKPHPRP